MKMKKIFKLTISIFICIIAFAFASCLEFKSCNKEKGSLEYETHDGYCEVTGIGTCTDTDIVIPETYNNLPVTIIGERAFYNCMSLTSIKIPDSVTSIGEIAFIGCSSLTSVRIGDSVISIGSSAFYGCTNLTSVEIPDSVKKIGDRSFSDCTNLINITIPDSVTSIGDYAFYNTGYYNDESNWENEVLYIGKYLIKAKEAITGAYTIKDGTPFITDGAFSYCRSLTSVEIPDSVTGIGNYAFMWCTSLTSVTIPDSVKKIGDRSFSDCSSLTSIEIPDSVTSIGPDAFDNTEYYDNEDNWENEVLYIGKYLVNSKNPINVTIKDSTLCIADYAFANCRSLTSIEIPDSVTSIGDDAFYECTSLTSIEVDENNAIYKDIDGNLYTKDGITLIQYAIGKTITSFKIPDSVTRIGMMAFRNCTSLTSVTIGDSVTSIGNFAFYYCTSLTSIVIGDSVTSIGGYAFYNCISLTSITFNGTVREWNAIEKGADWNGYANLKVPAAEVVCTDGSVVSGFSGLQ